MASSVVTTATRRGQPGIGEGHELVASASDGGLDDGVGWSVVGCEAGYGGALGAAAPVVRLEAAAEGVSWSNGSV